MTSSTPQTPTGVPGGSQSTPARPITSVLIANRGEIAMRVVRTARELGIRSIAVYSDYDINSPAARHADEAYALEGTSMAATYMNQAALLEIARKSGADAIHPGYGFLSESAEFAQAVTDAGFIWLGPRPQAIAALGDKMQARAVALSVGVGMIPGTSTVTPDTAAAIGFPLLLKRADGGGGRGIERIDDAAALTTFLYEHAQRGDLSLYFAEKLVEKARHLETQCARDAYGNFAIVSTRDCSLQRRNQKLIEEAPAPFLPSAVERQISEWSRLLFEAVEYVGLGTVEFLFDGAQPYFLEVNPRLQVEHTVSEEVTGVDLVELQLRIAAGETLPELPPVHGHSIELRITSEDPANGLAPSSGTITRLDFPAGQGVRIDSGVCAGDSVSAMFDSMIAKVIVTAPTRERALAKADSALREMTLEGIATPISLYRDILATPEFRGLPAGTLGVYTQWLETEFLPSHCPASSEMVDGAAASPTGGSAEAGADPAAPLEREEAVIEIDGRRLKLAVPSGFLGGFGAPADAPKAPPQPLRKKSRSAGSRGGASDGALVAPGASIVIKTCVEVGQAVAEGDLLVVLEAMKMERYIRASEPGVVTAVHVEAGQNVAAGAPLLTVAPASAAETDATPESEDRP